MTSAVRSPLYEAEPFQASQGVDELMSPKDLQDFYMDMEKRELERRQSRSKTRRWSRKGSTKDGSLSNVHGPQQTSLPPVVDGQQEEQHEWEVLEQQAHAVVQEPSSEDHTHDADDERSSSVADLRNDSLIPPRWSYGPPDDVPALIAAPTSYRVHYPIHNPVGPRFYRNHHLRPYNSSAVVAAQYPPSAFSSAFPPLAPLPARSPVLGLGHSHLHAHNRPPQFPSPGTSRSSSESALPTPDSSQSTFLGPTHEAQQGKGSKTPGKVGADPVDLMDGSDPWGQKFHHDSPYDLGKKGKGAEQGSQTRTWGGSSTAITDSKPSRFNHRRKTTPSPLSQSTSAIHLQSEGEGALPENLGRKLSKKRRTSGGLKGLFGHSQAPAGPSTSRESSPSDVEPPPNQATVSAPVTPIEPPVERDNALALPPPGGVTRKLSKSRPTNASTGSIASVLPPHQSSPEKGGKRTSVLGRIAKRFSIARKPEGATAIVGKRGLFERGRGKESVVSLTETDKEPVSDTGISLTRPQDERKTSDLSKRIPPPPLDSEPSVATSVSLAPKDFPSTLSHLPPGPAPPPAQPSTYSIAQSQLPELAVSSGLGLLKLEDRADPHLRDSLLSIDPQAAWRLGKLTIANPDLPGGSETESMPGDRDHILSVRNDGDAYLFVRGNGDALVGSKQDKEPALPPLPAEMIEAHQIESGTPRASTVAPRPPSHSQPISQPRPPSPSLPPSPKSADLPAPPSPVQRPPPVPQQSPSAVEPSRSQVDPLSTTDWARAAAVDSTFDRPPSKVDLPSSSFAQSPQLKLASSASSTAPSRHIRQNVEHEYHIDVPVDGSLFARTAPGGGSAPPVEKPILPSLPPKTRHRESSEQPVVNASSLRISSKEPTIFTSIFATPPRSRHTSESSPDKTSSHGHGQTIVSHSSRLHRPRGHLRTGSYSPEKPETIYVRTGSESPDKEGRRERAKERERDREARRERRTSERERASEQEDRTRRRERERRESSARRREKEESDRERERRREERAREKERERAREKEREHEREKERGRQREREKEREEREREKIREREREREKEKAQERQAEKERERERARAREKERGREKERERDRERGIRKDKESRSERETEKYRLVPRSSLTSSNSNHRMRSNSNMDVSDDADDLVRLSAMGQDWEVVESSRPRKRGRDRDDRHREKSREDGYATASAAIPHRSSTNVKEPSKLIGSGRRESRSGDRAPDTRINAPVETLASSSRSDPRPRAYSLETPHSRPPSTRPPTPPEKTSEQQVRQRGDKRYSQPSSSAPNVHTSGFPSRPNTKSMSTPYVAQRPSSGFPSPDQFKAKEAWEHDRLWRGQSMTFGSDAVGGGSAASTSAPVAPGPWTEYSSHTQPSNVYGHVNGVTYYPQPPPAHHGSSYTSFMVQPSWSVPQYPQYSQPPQPHPPQPIQSYSIHAPSNPLPPPPRQSAFDTRTPPRA